MPKKSAKKLETDIAEALSDKSALPSWNPRRGWIGGNSRTLYTFEDDVTGRLVVSPGGRHIHAGPSATVRMSTQAEAERHWQSPLAGGWKVAP